MEIVYHLPCTEILLSLRLGSGPGARVWAERCKKPFAGRPGHARPRDSMAADRSPVPVEFIFPLKLLSVYADFDATDTNRSRRELQLETGQPEPVGCRRRWSPRRTCRVAGGTAAQFCPTGGFHRPKKILSLLCKREHL